MNLVFFVLYCFMMTASPGPTNIMILSTVHNYGVKRALTFSLGSGFGFFTLLVLCVVFNVILLSYLPKIIFVLQGMGALYMVYLAYSIFKISDDKKNNYNTSTFKTGFLMQFINPKSLIFTLSVFPSFIFPYYNSFLSLSFFIFMITFIACMSFFSWILFGKILKSFLDKHNRLVNNIMALFLLVCAVIISGILK
ncbi:MAG: lysine transporter LysE [Arcobacter sp.]|nr:MAG: lysine transporter LysE [Arcobacter sp.]